MSVSMSTSAKLTLLSRFPSGPPIDHVSVPELSFVVITGVGFFRNQVALFIVDFFGPAIIRVGRCFRLAAVLVGDNAYACEEISVLVSLRDHDGMPVLFAVGRVPWCMETSVVVPVTAFVLSCDQPELVVFPSPSVFDQLVDT